MEVERTAVVSPYGGGGMYGGSRWLGLGRLDYSLPIKDARQPGEGLLDHNLSSAFGDTVERMPCMGDKLAVAVNEESIIASSVATVWTHQK